MRQWKFVGDAVDISEVSIGFIVFLCLEDGIIMVFKAENVLRDNTSVYHLSRIRRSRSYGCQRRDISIDYYLLKDLASKCLVLTFIAGNREALLRFIERYKKLLQLIGAIF